MNKTPSTESLNQVFYALSHPIRRKILTHICQESVDISTLAAPHNVSMAAISKHITVLEKAGLLVKERNGTNIICKAELWGLESATKLVDFLREYA